MATAGKETNHDSAPLAETIEKALANIALSTNPVVITGVNRKINTGNYENIDVYAGIAIPVTDQLTPEMIERIEELVDMGIKISSAETYKRYAAVKDLLKGESSQ